MPKSKAGSRRQRSRRRGPTPAKQDSPRRNEDEGHSRPASVSSKRSPRPRWNKPAGWALIAAGVLIAIVNDVAYFSTGILPGGHNELYLILGLLIGVFGAYLLGVFARP